jgi:hypothetical protein
MKRQFRLPNPSIQHFKPEFPYLIGLTNPCPTAVHMEHFPVLGLRVAHYRSPGNHERSGIHSYTTDGSTSPAIRCWVQRQRHYSVPGLLLLCLPGPTLSINTSQQHQHLSIDINASFPANSRHYGREIDRVQVSFPGNTLGRFNASVIVRSLGLLLLFPSPSNSMHLSPAWSGPGRRPHLLRLQPLPFQQFHAPFNSLSKVLFIF